MDRSDDEDEFVLDIELPSREDGTIIPDINDIEKYLSSYRYRKIDPLLKHENLFKLSKVQFYEKNGGSYLQRLFMTIALLVDPYTQPCSTGENNEYILSLQMISDLVIVLNYQPWMDWFDVCMSLLKIVERVSILLRLYDEYLIPFGGDGGAELDNTTLLNKLDSWTPMKILYKSQLKSKCHDLKLLYSIVSICFFTIGNIHKNYLKETNLSLNPFLSFFLKYWKVHTQIVVLGLDFDRNCELNQVPYPDEQLYPEIIRYLIKGSATVRNVLSIILNDTFELRVHDIKHESFSNFCSPWGRKQGTGALFCDMRLYVSAMLALGVSLLDVTSLLVNLEPDDMFDEDILYIFDYELDEGFDEDMEEVYDEETGEATGVASKEIHPDCNCDFGSPETDDDEEEEDFEEEDAEVDPGKIVELNNDNDNDEEEAQNFQNKVLYKFVNNDGTKVTFYEKNGNLYNTKTNQILDEEKLLLNSNPFTSRSSVPRLVRSSNSNGGGKENGSNEDWRDIPRGENVKFNEFYLKYPKKKLHKSWKSMVKDFESLTDPSKSEDYYEKLILSILKLIEDEKDQEVVARDKNIQLPAKKDTNDDQITPDKIYNFISKDGFFDKIVSYRGKIAFLIVDEMLMCPGYRRVLIWFITHLDISFWLIDYVHDLVVGNRKTKSRVGAIELSPIEQSMLLHEFFSNTIVYLSRGIVRADDEDDEEEGDAGDGAHDTGSVSKNGDARRRLASQIDLICKMIISFYDKGILKTEDPEYKNELQTLLLQWVFVSHKVKEVYDML